ANPPDRTAIDSEIPEYWRDARAGDLRVRGDREGVKSRAGRHANARVGRYSSCQRRRPIDGRYVVERVLVAFRGVPLDRDVMRGQAQAAERQSIGNGVALEVFRLAAAQVAVH